MKLPESDWIVRFRQSAEKGKADDLLDLLEQIRAKHSRVSATLTHLVRDYEFAKIVALLEAGDRHD